MTTYTPFYGIRIHHDTDPFVDHIRDLPPAYGSNLCGGMYYSAADKGWKLCRKPALPFTMTNAPSRFPLCEKCFILFQQKIKSKL